MPRATSSVFQINIKKLNTHLSLVNTFRVSSGTFLTPLTLENPILKFCFFIYFSEFLIYCKYFGKYKRLKNENSIYKRLLKRMGAHALEFKPMGGLCIFLGICATQWSGGVVQKLPVLILVLIFTKIIINKILII